jgi:hypothetical protein
MKLVQVSVNRSVQLALSMVLEMGQRLVTELVRVTVDPLGLEQVIAPFCSWNRDLTRWSVDLSR